MKTGILQSLSFAAMIVIFPSLFCTELQNPYTDPQNAKIDGDRSFQNLPVVLNTFQAYQCTLYVVLPELLDSIKIVRRQGTATSIVLFKPNPTKADTVVPAIFSITSTDQASIGAYVFRKNGGVDSLVKSLSTQYPHITSIVLPSRMTIYREYPCSLRVTLPQLVDSIRVMFRISGADVPVSTIKDVTAADSLLAFPLTVTESGQDSLVVALFCVGIKADSSKRKIVIQYPPTIAPDSMVYHTYVKDTAIVKFTIADLDGDIRECKVWIDSTGGTSISPPLAGTNRASTSTSWSVSAPSFDTVLVFAQAIDSAGNASSMVQCTVFVRDTAKPKLTLIHISPSIGDSIVPKLPCTLNVHVLDDSPIDSAKFVDQFMTVKGDTARVVVASLDTGAAHSYLIQAWDKAGNAGAKNLSIHYTGNLTYAFTFKNIVDRSVNENVKFPLINLDSCIMISKEPPGIPNWRDSIQWQVLETKPDLGIKATYDTATSIVTFAVPDSEWSGTESFTFVADWPNMATGYAGATYTINPINDPPVITWKNVTKLAKVDFDTILADKCVRDPDNAASTITWTQDTTRGKIYTLLWISSLGLTKSAVESQAIEVNTISRSLWSRKWKVVPKNVKALFLTGSTYTDTLRVMAKDAGALSATQDVIIKATY